MALNHASIPAILTARVAAHGGEVVLRKKDHGIWKATTWAQLGAHVRHIGIGLQAMGFRPGDVACVLAETRPEWVHIDLGILGAGGISGGIHPDDDAEQLGQALRDSRCRVLFVENEEQLDKALLVRDRCPALQRIVIIDMKGLREFVDPMCESLQAFTASSGGEGEWDAGIAALTEEQPALLFSDGGKARTLTHGEVLRMLTDAGARLGVRPGDERLALLPMCQVMERVFGLYLALEARAISNYLENPDTVIENLQEVKPTVLAADARIWQRLHARISDAAAGATPVQRLLYRAAVAAGERGGIMAGIARLCVLRAVRRELGFSRLRVAFIGGGPLPADVQAWAVALGIRIQHLDGQAARGAAFDMSYRPLKEEAYGT